MSIILKEFELSDDQILDIVLQERLVDAIALLKDYIQDKWIMDTLTAQKVVLALRKELN